VPEYPIIYDGSFIIFWTGVLLLEFYDGGLLAVAFTLLALLIIISHEHAHASQCLKNGNRIFGISFTWLGGSVLADIDKTSDKIDFYKAGIVDTGAYALAFVEIVAVLWFIHEYLQPIGINFAPNPYFSLLNSITVFAVVLFICNILPISFHSKKHDMIIMTDGWATYNLLKA